MKTKVGAHRNLKPQNVPWIPPVQTALNHRTVEVGRKLWGSPGPDPCSSRVSQSKVPMTVSSHVLNTSVGDSTASLGNLCQCSVTQTLKKCPHLERLRTKLLNTFGDLMSLHGGFSLTGFHQMAVTQS